jgi:hypothetical protein
MSLTILYHHPQRPDEGGMTMVIGQASAAAMMDRLEKRGFLIDKITVRYLPGHTSDAADPRPVP